LVFGRRYVLMMSFESHSNQIQVSFGHVFVVYRGRMAAVGGGEGEDVDVSGRLGSRRTGTIFDCQRWVVWLGFGDGICGAVDRVH
jgi:hypothetical protein